MAVAPAAAPGPVATQTFIFPAAVMRQPAAPPGAPATWGTHHRLRRLPCGDAVQADYAMDRRIADDPVYGPQLRDSFAALPILSLSGGDGIWQLYADPQARGRAVEQPIAVEFFDPQDREPGFAVDAGARIQGGAGRWEFMPKHSFRLFFRSDYGVSQLRHPSSRTARPRSTTRWSCAPAATGAMPAIRPRPKQSRTIARISMRATSGRGRVNWP
ncbi:MAG: hypothetical protein R2851_11985 [Caldilineaceae bacterium]